MEGAAERNRLTAAIRRPQPVGHRVRESTKAGIATCDIRVPNCVLEVTDAPLSISRSPSVIGQVDLGEPFVNAEIVQDGFAWRYPQHEFTAAEADAREHRRGLWAGSESGAALGVATSETAGIKGCSLIFLASAFLLAHAERHERRALRQ